MHIWFFIFVCSYVHLVIIKISFVDFVFEIQYFLQKKPISEYLLTVLKK